MNMKESIKNIIKQIRKINLWYQTVIKSHHNYRLSIYHKLRAIKYGFSSDFYHLYRLEKNNPKNYISEYKRVLSRDIVGKYKIILDDKLLFEKVFGEYITIPKNILTILEKPYDSNGQEVTKNKLEKVLCNEKYIIKPLADTGGGIGVELIKKTNDNKYCFRGKEMTSQDLYVELQKCKNCVVTEFVNQHEYSKSINSNSVNTIRIVTIRENGNGKYIIGDAVHRFGSKKSNIVDNASSGGYITKVDIKTGTLLETMSCEDTKTYDKHPDTGIKIKGKKIPHWDTVVNKLLEVAEKFPYIPFIAWDVVITKDGFCVIEGNASCSLELFQAFGQIKGTKLGDFYEYYGYIK